ncbi:FAD-dependent oxidoreductase [Pseudonocardia sp. NPDC049635]|uniref:FAD-dependent oxidoreductase n=1 Tax=Pseudonocardia sp. NPDC049635 TaxID=3155506 RepID=UPI0033FE61CC
MQNEFDVVVAGSGAAGLTAAMTAAAAGAEVLVLEAAAHWGGSSAMSGGHVWVPGNHHMAAAGVDDSFDDALRYCRHHSPDRDEALIRAFLTAAPDVVRFVEEHSELRFQASAWPDSFAESPGGRPGARHLEPAPLAVGDGWADEVWPTAIPPVLTNDEVFGIGLHVDGSVFPGELVEGRMARGEVTLGVALVVGLLRACRAAGVTMLRDARVETLLRDPDGRVTGVECAGEPGQVRARRGVVLATGGFEWDERLRGELLGAPMTHPVSPPGHVGDAVRMAGEVGAALARLGEDWCWPVTAGSGTWGDAAGTPRHSQVLAERVLPHVIWVNPAGKRFVNESSHNCALAFGEVDPATGAPRNLPAWAVGDDRYRQRYAVSAGAVEAPDLAALAKLIDVDPAGLEAAVERFNGFVRAGVDEDFHRGETAYDRNLGDPRADHPNLGTLERGPFFAVRIHPGSVGTKGGPRTDADARVLSWRGTPIEGLYAAGNAMAAVFGPGILAGGLSLAGALTWGHLAARHAMR